MVREILLLCCLGACDCEQLDITYFPSALPDQYWFQGMVCRLAAWTNYSISVEVFSIKIMSKRNLYSSGSEAVLRLIPTCQNPLTSLSYSIKPLWMLPSLSYLAHLTYVWYKVTSLPCCRYFNASSHFLTLNPPISIHLNVITSVCFLTVLHSLHNVSMMTV